MGFGYLQPGGVVKLLSRGISSISTEPELSFFQLEQIGSF